MAVFTVKDRTRALSDIAKEVGKTEDELIQANPNLKNINPSFIQGGSELKIPDSQPEAPNRVVRDGQDDTVAGVDSSLEDRRRVLREALETDVDAAPDRGSVESRLMDQAQAVINQVNIQFDRLKADLQKEGEILGQQQRGLNVQAGLSGSPRASANAQNIREGTRLEVESLERERTEKVNEILSGVRNRASEEFREERKAFREQTESELARLDALTEAALNDARSLAGAGVTLSEFKSQNPERYRDLLEQAGKSEQELEAVFIANQPEDTKIGSTTFGDSTVFFFQDPITGKIRQEKITADIPNPETIRSVDVRENGQAVVQRVVTDAQGNEKVSFEVVDLSKQGFEQESEGVFLSEDYLKEEFSQEELETGARDAGLTTGGIFGFGAEPDVDAYVQSLMETIERMRERNMSDKEIFKQLTEE